MQKIWDVRRPHKSPATKIEVVDASEVGKADSQSLITELYNRNVNIEDIFGHFYVLDEMATHRHLTVGDARLVGYGLPKINYNQPF